MVVCALAAIHLSQPSDARTHSYGLSYETVMKVLGIPHTYLTKPTYVSPHMDTLNLGEVEADELPDEIEEDLQRFQLPLQSGMPSYTGLGHFSRGYAGLG